jgi:hypothetical protein
MKRSSRRISRILSILLGVSMMFSLYGCGMQKLDGDGMVWYINLCMSVYHRMKPNS